jgi:hypothetical protein
LAGESTADKIDCNSVSGQSVGVESADIFIAGNLGPVLRQHAPAEWINLAEGRGDESTSALKTQAEAANT